ncbi:MAG TPA: PQQ-dependent sugar dehydrogenase [Pirellulales bacterium]|jgi:glucose/arabinose dehydrogenase|nr:PQQ-dependent sugar dehydrogenase [Pirellulales bacterium]
MSRISPASVLLPALAAAALLAAVFTISAPFAHAADEYNSQTNPVPIGEPIANVKTEVAFPNLNFRRPIFITYPPDGTNRMAVVSQYGEVLIFPNDPTVEDVHEMLSFKEKVVYHDNQNEEGFLGLAFHPNYKQNGQIYVYYTTTGAKHTGVLVRYHVSADDPNKADPNSAEEIFRSPTKPDWNHNGGTIIFGPDGYLYLCLGDGGAGFDPHGHGQDITTVLGKVLRLDVDHADGDKKYSIPKDNPFVDVPDAAGEIWALGLRNVWRMSFDRLTHKLWAGDVGQDTWEEVDIIERGHNYQWNQREGFHPLVAKPRSPQPGPPPEKTYGTLTEPIFDYNHSLGKCIVGGYVYRGKQVPELYGAYLFADYVTGRLYALWYDEKTGKTTSVQPIDPPPAPANPNGKGGFTVGANGLSVFSFGEDQAGEVYYTTVQGVIRHFRSAGSDTQAKEIPAK